VYENPFPPQGVGRFEYGWKAIKAMVNASENRKWKSVLTYANENSALAQQLVKFVSFILPYFYY
jgi:hypothetical protein